MRRATSIDRLDGAAAPVPEAVSHLRGPQRAAVTAAQVVPLLPMVRLVFVPHFSERASAMLELSAPPRCW